MPVTSPDGGPAPRLAVLEVSQQLVDRIAGVLKTDRERWDQARNIAQVLLFEFNISAALPREVAAVEDWKTEGRIR